MPVITLRNQRKAYLAGVSNLTGLFQAGQKIWTKPSAIPVISINAGASGGYAGSTYRSTIPGQWTADGAEIPGATGATYIMSIANEGKAIRCGASNTIRLWTPYQFDLTARLFWYDMRRAILVDDRIDRCADNWEITGDAIAPSASDRVFTDIVNGQLVGRTDDNRYPGNRRINVPPLVGLSETMVGYQTPAAWSPVPPTYGDFGLIGSAISNTWRRVRSASNSNIFGTEGSGTFVDETSASAGIAPTARIGSWRYPTLPNGVSLWGRGDNAGEGSLPGWYYQAFGFKRTLTNVERRSFNAYIAWVYGGAAAAAALPTTTYRNAPQRV